MDTVEQLADFVAARLNIAADGIDPDVDLRSLPGFDSLNALQIVLDVEQHYDIEVEDEQVFAAQTLREFAEVVDRLLPDTSAAS